MFNKKTFLLVAMIFALTTVLAGCGCGRTIQEKAAEKYIEGMMGGDVDITKDGFEITDEDGNTISGRSGKGLPSGWPNDVPYYKKGEIEQSSSMALPQGKNYAIIISSNDSIDDIMDFYKDEFGSDWNVDMEVNMGDTATLMVSKDGVTVTVGVDEENNEITQTVMTTVE